MYIHVCLCVHISFAMSIVTTQHNAYCQTQSITTLSEEETWKMKRLTGGAQTNNVTNGTKPTLTRWGANATTITTAVTLLYYYYNSRTATTTITTATATATITITTTTATISSTKTRN